MVNEERQKYGSEAVAAAADPATWEIWPAPEGHREVLYQRFPEFTCLCPRSDYSDFATVHLVTIPDRKVLELKHLKLWLNSFRDRARVSTISAVASSWEMARSRKLFSQSFKCFSSSTLRSGIVTRWTVAKSGYSERGQRQVTSGQRW